MDPLDVTSYRYPLLISHIRNEAFIKVLYIRLHLKMLFENVHL